MDISLNTDGPHSPEYTQEVANALAEAVRVLNYATLGDAPGLENPGDAYSLLAALYTATMRMPQLLQQVRSFLNDEASSGQLADDHQRDPSTQTAIAGGALMTAAEHAESLTRNLQQAQQEISGLYVKGD